MFRPVLIGLALLAASPVAAQDYPTKTVKIIVPFAPGGGASILARIIAQRLQETWGQTILIENQPGASGGTGSRAVMRAPADGYTLLMASTGALMAASSGANDFDVNAHLQPVTLVAAPPYVITVNPKLGAGTTADFIRMAKQRGADKSFSYGSSGVGAASHLTGELFQKEAKIDMLHVPYNGTGPVVNDLLAGHIDAMFAPPQTVQALVEAGQLKALATTGSVRSPLFPDVPTVAEGGVAGFEAVGWFGLLAPPKTPAAIVKKINAEIVALLETPDIKQRLAALGADPQPQSPEQFGVYINADIAKWTILTREVEAKQSKAKP